MDPLLIAIVAGITALALGVFVGRSTGRAAALEAGRAAGRDEGRRLGTQDGRKAGAEEGRRTGLEEGRKAGLEEGRRAGLDEGRKAGLEEGRRGGFEEGRKAGLEEGRRAGFEEGRSAGIEAERAASDARLRSLVESVRRGRLADGMEEGTPEAELQSALRQGWAPREAEREAALREAVGRVSTFLHASVRAPLAEAGPDADAEELRERVAHALGALQDLDFFIGETEATRQGTDLTKLAQSVSRDFAGDQDIAVRLLLGSATVRAEVNPPALMDALYLLLHNAGRFGGGATIDLSVEQANGKGVIRVRDRGPGFTEEAFARAFDPFYSTSDDGLGLGLPHARKVIEAMGGEIQLRNVPDGGAEVEVSFPLG